LVVQGGEEKKTMASFGRNIRLDRSESEQALCTRAFDLAVAKGVLAPGTDKLDFLRRAKAHVSFREPGPDSAEGFVSDVMITWEE